MPTAIRDFKAFNLQHIIALAVILGFCLLIAFKARSSRIRKWLGPLIGCLLIGYAAALYIQQGLTHSLAWRYSLPLDLCNLILAACAISLFCPNRFLTEIAYFCGLGGVLQATATPDLVSGFPSWDFIQFFWGHGVTLTGIIFLVSDGRFSPSPKTILKMMAALNLYGLVVGILDWAMGWNYGYLCRKPDAASLFDVLGPWPWYLLSVEAIAFVSFWLLYLPWHFSRIRSRDRAVTADHS